MKYLFITIVLTFCTFFTACDKGKTTATTPTYGYTINGLQDITIQQYVDTSISLPLAASYLSGSQENITLSISNLPAGLSVSPGSITGTPSFNPVFTISGAARQTGTFQVTLTVSAPSSGTQTFTFRITVAANAGGCTSKMGGIYQTHYTCGTQTIHDSHLVTTGAGKLYLQGISIEPEFYMLTTVTANVNCDDKTFICDSINLSGSLNLTFYGSGDIRGDSITVHYHGVHEGNAYNCTAVYKK